MKEMGGSASKNEFAKSTIENTIDLLPLRKYK
jgi:hypothetical protein